MPFLARRTFGRRSIGLLVAVLLVACALLFVAKPVPSPGEPRPTAEPTSPVDLAPPSIKVFFTAPIYPDTPQTRKPSLDEQFVSFIASARHSLAVAVFQLDLATIVDSLIASKQRGVALRIVTDIDVFNDPRNGAAFKQLEAAGIAVVAGNKDGIMHHKFAVADVARVWTGSWNFTANDTWRYNNNALVIDSPGVARAFAATFERLHVQKQFGKRGPAGADLTVSVDGVAIQSLFAPDPQIPTRIVERIRQAERSIDFMAYAFTDDAIAAAMLERARSGVSVRGVFETIGSETRFSEYGRLKEAGLDVHQDGNPYLMHHKVIIVDGKTVITGSYNFSASAASDNDENLLIIDDRRVAGYYEREFARVLEAARKEPAKIADLP